MYLGLNWLGRGWMEGAGMTFWVVLKFLNNQFQVQDWTVTIPNIIGGIFEMIYPLSREGE